MKTSFYALLLVPLLLGACNKNHDTETGIVGNWGRTEVYKNEFWGGLFTWQPANDGTGVRFTADGLYYRNDAKTASKLVGTYKLRANHKIEVTATGATTVTESFTYDVDEVTNQLEIGYYATEGTLKERFVRN